MNSKRLTILFIILTLVFSFVVPIGATAENSEIKVLFNGEQLEFDTPPTIIDGRTLVPLRSIFEKFGYTVDWNGDKQRVIAKNSSSSIQIDINDTLVILNDYDSYTTLDVPAQIIDGRTMVPLRFVATAANYDVLWEEETKTVYIETIYDGTGAPRQYQSVAMVNDNLLFTDGHKISNDGRIFEEIEYASGNSLQAYNGFLYFRNNDLYLCKANIETYETETITKVPVANTMITDDKLYYSKMDDKTHALYQADLDGSNEKLMIDQPCGDYRVVGDKIYFIHMHSQNLLEFSISTGQTKTIYDGFTTCLDVSSDNKVYYGMAEYTNERTPLTYKGIGYYDLTDNSYRQLLNNAPVGAEDIWVLGDNLFYQTAVSDQHFDLYRHSLKYGYNMKILSEIYGGTEIHGKRIFYYPVNDDSDFDFSKDGKAALYVANTRGTNGFPVMSLVFSAIGWYAADQNVPDQEHFNEYLERDLKNYIGEKFGNDVTYKYILLSKQAETDMNGGATFYAWVDIFSADGTAVDAGVIPLRAKDKEKFIASSFTSKTQIIEDESRVNAFPKIMRKRILELAEK